MSAELILNVRQIYHDWFKDSADDNDTAATPSEIDAILAGRNPLPPGAIIHFDVGVNPPSTPITEIPIPLSLQVGMSGPVVNDYVVFEATSSDSPYEGGFCKVKPGKFNKSKGYNGLLVTYEQTEGPHKLNLFVFGNVDGVTLRSNVVEFPWVAKQS